MAGAAMGAGAQQERERDVLPREPADMRGWTPAGAVHGPLGRRELAELGERSHALLADPLPLGLAGFASATFTISAVLAGWFRGGDVVIAIPVALVFGGIVQFLAGMWAFRRGEMLPATAFASFGAFNASWALLQWMGLNGTLPNPAQGDPRLVTGVFILTFALIALYLAVAAVGENAMVAAILFILALTYLLDGVGTWIGGSNVVLGIGGYAGMVTSLLAFYLSAATVVNAVRQREAFPIFATHHGA